MRKVLLLLIIIGVGLLAAPEVKITADKKIWIRIDSLETQGLYRSALRLADQVYHEARGMADPETEIKALIYRLKYIQELEEDGQLAAINELIKEMPDNRLVESSLKHSMLAELYYRYYTANRWEINRNEQEAGVTGQQVKNWSPERFFRVILDQYDLSLAQRGELSTVRVSSLPGLWSGNLADTVNKPTLYDVLISRSVNFLQNASEFQLPCLKPGLFCGAELFREPMGFYKAIPDEEKTGYNPYYRTMAAYFDWLHRTDPSAQVSVDLDRLKYVREQSCNESADSLYESALQRRAERLGHDGANASVFEALAQYHLDRSGLYQINNADTLKYLSERKMAHKFLTNAQEWENTLAARRCRNMLTNLMKPELTVQSEAFQIPATSFPVSVEYRNIKMLYYKMVRLNARTWYSDWNELEPGPRLDSINAIKTVRSGRTGLPDNGDLNPHRANMIIDPLPAGFYLMVFSDHDTFSPVDNLIVITPVSVTGTTLVVRQAENGKREFYFRDRDKGSPLPGLSVVPWYSLYDQDARRQVIEKGMPRLTGPDGYLEITDGSPGRNDPSPKAYRLEVIHGSDTLVTQEMYYPGYGGGKPVLRTGITLFTDRSIYKPGDRTFFRGVLIDYLGDSMSIHKTDSIALTLQDPRYQTIGQVVLPVDSFGVFSGSVVLPLKGLTGYYLIHTKYGQASVRMEQYRRPAFTLSINPDNHIFNPGDTLKVSGQATGLSGEPVSGAEVVADIDLQPVFGPFKWSPFNGQKIRITTIKGVTGRNGTFSCKWVSLPAGSNPFGNSKQMRYTASIRVTDLNGESHQEEATVDCGKESTGISIMIPGKIHADESLKGSIQAQCTDGRIIGVPVKLIISKLTDPARVWTEPVLPEPDRYLVTLSDWQKRIIWLPYKKENKPSSWPVASTIMQKNYTNDTITSVSLIPEGGWKAGWYKIELAPADPLICKPVIRYLQVEDPQPARIPNGEFLYAGISATSLVPGKTLDLRYASELKGSMLVDLRKRSGQLLTAWYPSDNRTGRIRWKITEAWQGGAVLNVIMIRRNRVFEEQFGISVPWMNSGLNISGFEKLKSVQPGDSVNIRIKVSDEHGQPVHASVGVTVYDASLELIAPHFWQSISRPGYYGGASFAGMNSAVSGSYTVSEPNVRWLEVPEIEPVGLNWYGLGFYGISRSDAPVMKMAMAMPDASKAPGGKVQMRGAIDEVTAKGKENSEPAVADQKSGEVSVGGGQVVIRKDFRETAIFEGSLVTDTKGEAVIRFTVPEVFTEWKAMVAAHDTNLAFGSIEYHFRSSKDLMIRPNLPAFMRVGDTVELAARLGWYGKSSLEPVTSLVLADSTGNELKGFPALKSLMSSGDVLPYYWTWSPLKTGSVRYQIKSQSSVASDGLTDTIHVSPDEVQLWNAQPFFFAGPGKKQLKVEPSPLEARFEVTTTPAWMVLQSLPVVTGKERDCSEYWFSRLYLACLAGTIADRFPLVAAKYLSDSVPEKQKERIMQIRNWMNPATRSTELAYVLEKLASLQNQDGTWPWYRGMGSDLFMTQQIIAGLGELKRWGVFDITVSQSGNYMVTHAIEAMDGWMYRQFREVIRLDSIHPVKVQLDPMTIHYLYTRSFFTGLTLAPANEIAWIYFADRIPVEWTAHDPGLQALMGITCVQLGRKQDALPVFKSLRERSKTEEQWGMYWPRKGFASSWFNWDIWMQSRMIEFFAGIDEGRKDLDQMKLYLIHQKRGRDWGNGMVAAWACKSLLFYGTALTIQPASVAMTWGSETYSPLRVRTGSQGVTGYYRFEWKKPEEMPKAATMEITQTDGGPSWGTLFTLNGYKIDKLAATAGPMNLSREILTTDGQGGWTALKKGDLLHVGSRILIRLDIRSDRELSYIELKDFLGTGVQPVQVHSGYQWRPGLFYYQSRDPESVGFYISQLPKGVSTIEYQAIIEQAGSYSGGYATATSLYAPEFRGWSGSYRIHASR